MQGHRVHRGGIKLQEKEEGGNGTLEEADYSTARPRELCDEANLFAELSDIKLSGSFTGRQLQRLAAAAAAQGIRDPRAWAAISARAIELNRSVSCNSVCTLEGPSALARDAQAHEAHEAANAHEDGSPEKPTRKTDAGAPRGFRHFEALHFLSSLLSAGFKDTELLLSFDDIFLRQLHAFDCRHLLQLLHICEQHNYRTRRLYTPLFKTLAMQAPTLLFQEITDVFCSFAAHRVGSTSCSLSLLRAAAAQVPNASLSDSIRLCGALSCLGITHEALLSTAASSRPEGSARAATSTATSSQAEEAAATVLALVEQRVAFLVEGLPLQLLLDEVLVVRPTKEMGGGEYQILRSFFPSAPVLSSAAALAV